MEKFDELQKWKINFRILNQVFQSIEITEEKLIYISWNVGCFVKLK